VGDNKFELQTAVTTYKVPGSNQSVSLISLVHLADPRYYRELEALAEVWTCPPFFSLSLCHLPSLLVR
jgi:hypothetical protein